MLNLILIYYYLGINTASIFLMSQVIIALLIKSRLAKYYRPIYTENPKTNIHEKFKAFSRTDTEPSFTRIFLGLISFSWIKIISMIVTGPLGCYISLRVLSLFGASNLKSSLFPIVKKAYAFHNRMCLLSMGFFTYTELQLQDKATQVYRKYLGKSFDYNRAMTTDDFVTYIANHTGWLDIFLLAYKTSGSFASKLSVKSIPLMGFICESVHTVWIDRDNKDAKKSVMTAITERQDQIARKLIDSKMVFFPEGTGTNNTGLIQFKKGAFANLHAVKPFYIEVDKQSQFSTASAATAMWLHILLCSCFLWHNLTVYDLPAFEPNDYLYDHYSNLGRDRPEIYMNACRAAISEIIEVPLYDDSNYEAKLNYLSGVKGKKVKGT